MEFAQRKSPRLQDHEYKCGCYFLTICADRRRNIFGSIVGEGFPLPQLSPYGLIVNELIEEIPMKYEMVRIQKYIIMPNHIHLLLSIEPTDGRGDPSPTVSTVVGWFKYQATKRINVLNATIGERIFQRSFYDHVVRNEIDFNEIREYIDQNPKRWAEDRLFSETT